VTVLEARVDELAVKVERDREIAWTAYREAQDARVWHKHNVELLRAVRESQAEHTTTLAEHGQILAEQGRILAEHGRILAEHTTTLTEHGRILVEHGRRLDNIEGKLGTITLGVHDIQLMLRHLVEREGGESASPPAG
jgi:hypothetical protein